MVILEQGGRYDNLLDRVLVKIRAQENMLVKCPYKLTVVKLSLPCSNATLGKHDIKFTGIKYVKDS